MGKTTFTRDDANARLTIERTFDASRERVWEALTDPILLDQWWAPSPWKTETVRMDFRVGGHWLYAMSGPDGEQHFGRMDFIEIEPGRRYKSDDAFTDETGTPIESLPRQVFDTTLHEDAPGQTRVVTVVAYASLADLEKIVAMGMQEGVSMAHDQLEALLAA
jgi:uncharacterized protein YndB with AHSA1/START domain